MDDEKSSYELAQYRYWLRMQVDCLVSLEDQIVATSLARKWPTSTSYEIRKDVMRARDSAEKQMFQYTSKFDNKGHTTIEYMAKYSRKRMTTMLYLTGIDHRSDVEDIQFRLLKQQQKAADETLLSLTVYKNCVHFTDAQLWAYQIILELEFKYSLKLIGDEKSNLLGPQTTLYLDIEKQIEEGSATQSQQESYAEVRDQVPLFFCMHDLNKIKHLLELVFKPNIINGPIINVERVPWGTQNLARLKREAQREPQHAYPNTRDTGTNIPEVVTLDTPEVITLD